MPLLLISGSLRSGSSNAAVPATATTVLPEGVTTTTYHGMADLPHFNPDDDRDPLPGPVAGLRAAIGAAGAVLFCTPEYAGALPGSFKNLLDWTIGVGEIYQKPPRLDQRVLGGRADRRRRRTRFAALGADLRGHEDRRGRSRDRS